MTDAVLVSPETLLSCTRPILFENKNNENEEVHTYSIGATCFIVEYLSSAFVVTADHCLEQKGVYIAPEQLLVQYHPGGDTFLPFSKIYSSHDMSMPDADKIDIAVARIATEQISADERERLKGFRIKSLTESYKSVNANASFVFRGYPYSINRIDEDTEGAITYDENAEMHVDRDNLKSVIRRQAFAGNGLYVSKSIFPLSHTIKFSTQPLPIESINGLSGSPVFQIESEGGIQRGSLIGIITNGSTVIAHFLDAIVLFEMLQKIMAD